MRMTMLISNNLIARRRPKNIYLLSRRPINVLFSVLEVCRYGSQFIVIAMAADYDHGIAMFLLSSLACS